MSGDLQWGMMLAGHPAFTAGQRWTSTDGAGHTVEITEVRRWARHSSPWHHDVHYKDSEGIHRCKDLWSFQVRYEPIRP